MNRALVAACILFLVITVTDATQCFKCSSKQSGKCGDTFDGAIIGTIDCILPSCYKKMEGGEITRGCSNIMKDERCNPEGAATVCYCRRDLCNQSTATVVSMATVALAVLVHMALRFT